MLRNTAEELLLVHDGRIEEYREDLEGYERWILSNYKKVEKPGSPAADTSRKEKRQQAATQRDEQRPLQKQLNKTEKEMAEAHSALLEVREQLGNADLYAEEHKHTLADLLKREGELKTRADELDDTWLEQQQLLEELSQQTRP